MVYIPSDFDAPKVPDLDDAERELDAATLAALPEGCQVISITVHSASHWALIHRIDTILSDGTKKAYFLKVLVGQLGKDMAKGEYEGDLAIHAIIPRNSPKPLAHGTYTKDPNRHFVLCEFLEMDDEMPSVKNFVTAVVELHQKSVSPTGKFGFHCTTHAGNYPLNNEWCDSWEEFFARQLREEVVWERSIQGQDDEMDQLLQALFEKVIPRLLRPLQTGGRSIKPTLVHGDLWHGNVGIDMSTDQPILFDPCATYAHNETNRPHQTAYFDFVDVSEPADDRDDRNALYAFAIEEMRRLVAKYPDGIDGFKDASEQTQPNKSEQNELE